MLKRPAGGASSNRTIPPFVCGGTGRRAGSLSPNTIRLALAPAKALFATAVEDGLIRTNPAAKVRIPLPEQDPEERAKALTEEELRRLLGEIPEGSRLLFEFLAQTGLRIGEAAALTWADLDFARRRVRVRRRLYRGKIGPPKSKHGRRDVPISKALARALSARWNETRARPEEPIFATRAGRRLDASNVMARILKPAARRAGVGWASFHTFRHTCASMLFRRGVNVKAVSIWLGHSDPGFTLRTYIHLLPDDLPEPTFFDEEPAEIEGQPEGVETPAEAIAA